MNNFKHNDPGQSIFQGSDLASIQVNNNFQDDNEDHLDIQRLDQEVQFFLNMCVYSYIIIFVYFHKLLYVYIIYAF
jgi:hypothetical protein